MSSLALGFGAATATAGLLLPDGGTLYYGLNPSYLIKIHTDTQNSKFVNPQATSTSFILYANQEGRSDTTWDFAFTTAGVISFYSNFAAPTETAGTGGSKASWWVWDGVTYDFPSQGSEGNLGVLSAGDTYNSGLINVTIAAGDHLQFEVSSTESGLKPSANLNITVVPEPATWISGFLLLGVASFTLIRNNRSEPIKAI